MSDSLLPVLLMIVVASGMAGGILFATHAKQLLRKTKFALPKKIFPGATVDRGPYECGMKPDDQLVRHRFSIHFYLVAMLFILFDIEAAFLFPWAVTFRTFAADRMFVLGEMAVFLGILIAGFAYVWKRGALEWD